MMKLSMPYAEISYWNGE